MLASLGFIFLAGLALAAVCRRLGLPGLVGMLAAGILLGPHALGLLGGDILGISAQLRQMALVVILLKAGLTLDLADLKRVGRPAVLMSFLPASCEILAFVLFAPALLGVGRAEAAVMGAVMGAVSPAVVVPRMVRLMDTGYGTGKGIPQLILAGASCDDVFVIVLFSSFTGMAQGGGVRWQALAGVPVAILLGAALGAAAGCALAWLFARARACGRPVRASHQLLILLGAAFLLTAAEGWLEGLAPMSGLLAVMGLACALRLRSPAPSAQRLAQKLGKVWLAAEVLLFVLVGAAVDVRYTLRAGPAALAMIALALGLRSLGVAACLLGTPLCRAERLFCVLAYLPKATVQAAIGSVPLALGLPCGQLVRSVAVVGILVTAPLGALAIDRSYPRLLGRAPQAGPPA